MTTRRVYAALRACHRHPHRLWRTRMNRSAALQRIVYEDRDASMWWVLEPAGARGHRLSQGGPRSAPEPAPGAQLRIISRTVHVRAASQALSFACPACHVLELQPVYGPAQKDLVDRPVWHTKGYVNRPDGPGLGIEIDEDLVASARLDR